MTKSALILVQNLPVPFDRRVWQEATTLQSEGWNVSVVCPSNEKYPEGDFVIDGVSVSRFKSVIEARTPIGYLREYFQSLTRMRRKMKGIGKKSGLDVVQFCNPPDLLALIALEAKLQFRAKIIFDQHDLGPELVVAKKMAFAWFFVQVARLFENIAYMVADRVIATNESYKSVATKRGKKDPQVVTVVRSAPSRNWAANTFIDDKYRQGHQFQLGYLGVIGQQEGLDFALDAVKILKEKFKKDVFFTIVGSGTDLEKMKVYARVIGVSDNVKFFGRLPDDEMKQVLASSDVCLNPDVFSELNNLSTMNKIIEYMALGVAIVQFDLQEGRYSAASASLYAVPDNAESLAEKINVLLDDENLRNQMAEFGKKRFQEVLCWETQRVKLVETYESLLNFRVTS